MTDSSPRQRWIQVALAVLVVAVWGGVAYRVGGALPEETGRAAPPAGSPVTAVVADSAAAAPLPLAVLRDPFSPRWPGADDGTGAPRAAAPAPAAEAAAPPDIALTGVIGDTAILEVPDGTIHLVRVGDRVDEVEVREVHADRVELSLGPHRFTISFGS